MRDQTVLKLTAHSNTSNLAASNSAWYLVIRQCICTYQNEWGVNYYCNDVSDYLPYCERYDPI